MNTVDYIVHGDYVLTMNKNLETIPDGAVAIKGKTIVAVGNKQDIFTQYAANKVLDKTGHVILPGLINTHCHAPMVYLRGIADDLPLNVWLEKHIWPTEKKWLSPQFVYDGTKLACLEMAKGGITTFADMYFFGNDLAKATKEIGMRGVIAPTIFDFPTNAAQSVDEYISTTEEFIKNWLKDDLITPSIGPHSPYACNPETLTRSFKVADKYDIPVQIHLAESLWEEQDVMTKYGKRPTKHLNDLGLLSERVIAAHCVWLNDEEIEILAQQKVAVSHCIESNLKLASGTAPIIKMLERGVKVSFGTDGAASNNDLNLLNEISTAAKFHKLIAKDPTVLNAKTALKMATSGGAQALNMQDKLGTLAPNFYADLITINLRKPNLLPIYDIYSQIVYAAAAENIETVMINGKLIMENRNILTCDENEILDKALEWHKKIMA